MILLGIGVVAPVPGLASEPLADPATARPRLRLELGAGTEISNEIFVEDAYVDTTFLGRRLVGDPEARWAALGTIAYESAPGPDPGRLRFRLRQDASVGDLLQRATFTGAVQGPLGLASTWQLAPRVDVRRDRTFDRDLTQWLAELGGRARHASDDGALSSEAGLRAEVMRSTGAGSDLVPDRLVGRAHLAFEGLPLGGPEWRVGYALSSRTFPDSTTRDHLEHTLDSRLRLASVAGHAVALEAGAERRSTTHAASTSRDRFLVGRGTLTVTARAGERWSLVAESDLELTRYDAPDSALYFDYRIARARLGPRFEGGGWTLSGGPRIEILTAPWAPDEAYREFAGFADLEVFARGAWWSLTPAGGWRSYDRVTAPELQVLHSSYRYAEASVLADQPLPAGWRVRATGLMRVEWHDDDTQDARSLYFSLELRRLL